MQICMLKCKTILLTLVVICVGLSVRLWAAVFDSEGRWQEYKSDHFLVYYDSGIAYDYIRDFTWECERYYNSITERLGFRRFNFWLWENRAKIFVYKDRKDYLTNTEQPQWSAASVHIRKKFINTYYFKEDFFNTVLPHELTHIILREFIGIDAQAPLWFDEGVACSTEQGGYSRYLSLTKKLIETNKFIALPQLEGQNRWQVSSPEIFYPTAAALIIFLMEKYDRADFGQLCRQLRDGDSFYEAMDKVYGIPNAHDLNEKFIKFLNDKIYY